MPLTIVGRPTTANPRHLSDTLWTENSEPLSRKESKVVYPNLINGFATKQCGMNYKGGSRVRPARQTIGAYLEDLDWAINTPDEARIEINREAKPLNTAF